MDDLQSQVVSDVDGQFVPGPPDSSLVKREATEMSVLLLTQVTATVSVVADDGVVERSRSTSTAAVATIVENAGSTGTDAALVPPEAATVATGPSLASVHADLEPVPPPSIDARNARDGQSSAGSDNDKTVAADEVTQTEDAQSARELAPSPVGDDAADGSTQPPPIQQQDDAAADGHADAPPSPPLPPPEAAGDGAVPVPTPPAGSRPSGLEGTRPQRRTSAASGTGREPEAVEAAPVPSAEAAQTEDTTAATDATDTGNESGRVEASVATVGGASYPPDSVAASEAAGNDAASQGAGAEVDGAAVREPSPPSEAKRSSLQPESRKSSLADDAGVHEKRRVSAGSDPGTSALGVASLPAHSSSVGSLSAAGEAAARRADEAGRQPSPPLSESRATAAVQESRRSSLADASRRSSPLPSASRKSSLADDAGVREKRRVSAGSDPGTSALGVASLPAHTSVQTRATEAAPADPLSEGTVLAPSVDARSSRRSKTVHGSTGTGRTGSADELTEFVADDPSTGEGHSCTERGESLLDAASAAAAAYPAAGAAATAAVSPQAEAAASKGGDDTTDAASTAATEATKARVATGGSAERSLLSGFEPLSLPPPSLPGEDSVFPAAGASASQDGGPSADAEAPSAEADSAGDARKPEAAKRRRPSLERREGKLSKKKQKEAARRERALQAELERAMHARELGLERLKRQEEAKRDRLEERRAERDKERSLRELRLKEKPRADAAYKRFQRMERQLEKVEEDKYTRQLKDKRRDCNRCSSKNPEWRAELQHHAKDLQKELHDRQQKHERELRDLLRWQQEATPVFVSPSLDVLKHEEAIRQREDDVRHNVPNLNRMRKKMYGDFVSEMFTPRVPPGGSGRGELPPLRQEAQGSPKAGLAREDARKVGLQFLKEAKAARADIHLGQHHHAPPRNETCDDSRDRRTQRAREHGHENMRVAQRHAKSPLPPEQRPLSPQSARLRVLDIAKKQYANRGWDSDTLRLFSHGVVGPETADALMCLNSNTDAMIEALDAKLLILSSDK